MYSFIKEVDGTLLHVVLTLFTLVEANIAVTGLPETDMGVISSR